MESVFTVVILGSLWGIFEATAGYFLHMLSLPIGPYVWYPIAFFFIYQAYRMTKSYQCVFATSLLASAFKLLDLLFTVRMDKVMNPSVSILLEAISFILVFQYIQDKSLKFLNILLTGFVWRTLYLCYVLLMPEDIRMISPAADTLSLTEFLFLYNVGSCLIIYMCNLVFNKVPLPKKRMERIGLSFNHKALLKPFVSIFLLMTAIVVKFITI